MKQKERQLTFQTQVDSGDRFEFGKNWHSFLKTLTTERISVAENSLTHMLKLENLKGVHFLDIGCGSGLFSLAAKNLGAKVVSFDFDPSSVACAKYLKKKYHENDDHWTIKQGSVLDIDFLSNLDKADIIYSWGVLHHTGKMLTALENVILPLKEEGVLFISIYNDQGTKSRRWLKVKKMYNSSLFGRWITTIWYFLGIELISYMVDILKRKNPFKRYKEYKKNRGMSYWHDLRDWLGGLPFEVARPELIVDFYLKRGFNLTKIVTKNGLGCNEYVFKRKS